MITGCLAITTVWCSHEPASIVCMLVDMIQAYTCRNTVHMLAIITTRKSWPHPHILCLLLQTMVTTACKDACWGRLDVNITVTVGSDIKLMQTVIALMKIAMLWYQFNIICVQDNKQMQAVSHSILHEQLWIVKNNYWRSYPNHP